MTVVEKVTKVRKTKMRRALKRMKSSKTDGPDDKPVEVWRFLREVAI